MIFLLHILLGHSSIMSASQPQCTGDNLYIQCHTVENMVAEVTLHNNIEMYKNCQKIAKKCQKLSKNCPRLPKNCPRLPKIVQNGLKLPKIERIPQQIYFPHCEGGQVKMGIFIKYPHHML